MQHLWCRVGDVMVGFPGVGVVVASFPFDEPIVDAIVCLLSEYLFDFVFGNVFVGDIFELFEIFFDGRSRLAGVGGVVFLEFVGCEYVVYFGVSR